MSFSIQKLRNLLPGQFNSTNAAVQAQRHSVSLEPEIGFQITIEASQQNSCTTVENSAGSQAVFQQKSTVPELCVHLHSARHLPTLFGFKIVQGYLIKVKLFPGSKRLDSTIQTNSWPKFNENFRFSLVPDKKFHVYRSSMKNTSRRGSRATCEFTPEELFEGQFVVFTVYALLELPPASFNRFNKTYRSLREKSTSLVQKVVESSAGKVKEENNSTNGTTNSKTNGNKPNPRDSMPPLTISESRRNIGSVTCYLEPKLFKRNARTGLYSTEELWLPIKDITTTVAKGGPSNNLAASTKGVVEIALELRDLSTSNNNNESNGSPTDSNSAIAPSTPAELSPSKLPPQWNRMTSDVMRKVKSINNSKTSNCDLVLRVTTARMRCSNKVKDELEHTAGSVYVKTSVFEFGVLQDSWKSPNFYPSLSTKWDVGDSATLIIPLKNMESLNNILIRTTLATKTKMGKKLVLGTVVVSAMEGTTGTGLQHMQNIKEALSNERIAMWHNYQ